MSAVTDGFHFCWFNACASANRATRFPPLATLHRMSSSRTFSSLFLIAGLLGQAAPASADWMPQGAFAEGGAADHGAYAATVGVVWPWSWQRESWGGAWSGHTEAFASHWSLRASSGRDRYTLLGVAPIVRYTFDAGRSPWFLEGGIGVSALDSKVDVPDKQMSTRLNFYDVIAAGRALGQGRRQEISLRLTHISNAGINKPNPGQEFVQLRYAARF